MENEAKQNDPRVRRTRKLLQQALDELMREKKFTDITVQDISARAEVNRATFYAHFMDKYDLINAITRERFQQALTNKMPDEPLFTMGNLTLLIQLVYEYLAGFPGQCRAPQLHPNEHAMIVQQVRYQAYVTLLTWLKRTPEILPEGVSVEAMALTTSWTIFGSMLQITWESAHTPNPKLMEEVLRIIEASVRRQTPEIEQVGS